MKHTNNTTYDINKKLIDDNDNAKYVMMLCNDNPSIALKTEYGIGLYKFMKFNEIKGTLVLEFNLLKNSKFKDTGQIYDKMGKTCFLSVEQYLYVCGSALA
tara:strand:+ start:590 stop:892 length:303 start_codon:yes stop_codon:yes gene_type:complete